MLKESHAGMLVLLLQKAQVVTAWYSWPGCVAAAARLEQQATPTSMSMMMVLSPV